MHRSVTLSSPHRQLFISLAIVVEHWCLSPHPKLDHRLTSAIFDHHEPVWHQIVLWWKRASTPDCRAISLLPRGDSYGAQIYAASESVRGLPRRRTLPSGVGGIIETVTVLGIYLSSGKVRRRDRTFPTYCVCYWGKSNLPGLWLKVADALAGASNTKNYWYDRCLITVWVWDLSLCKLSFNVTDVNVTVCYRPRLSNFTFFPCFNISRSFVRSLERSTFVSNRWNGFTDNALNRIYIIAFLRGRDCVAERVPSLLISW